MNTILQSEHDKHWKGRELLVEDNMRRNELIKEKFASISKDAKILDFACGKGDMTAYLLSQGFTEVYSVDFSVEGVAMTKMRGGKNVLESDICGRLPYEDGFFDYILWLDNIEHLSSPQSAMDNIKRILKNSGKLFVSLPNMGYWFYRLYYLKNGAVIGTDGVLPDGHINMPWEYQHIRFFNEKFIRKFHDVNEFTVDEILPYNNGNKLLHGLCRLYRRFLADGFVLISHKNS